MENKSVMQVHPLFESILMTYMKHLKKPKGIILNFNVQNLVKEGCRIFVNEYFAEFPEE